METVFPEEPASRDCQWAPLRIRQRLCACKPSRSLVSCFHSYGVIVSENENPAVQSIPCVPLWMLTLRPIDGPSHVTLPQLGILLWLSFRNNVFTLWSNEGNELFRNDPRRLAPVSYKSFFWKILIEESVWVLPTSWVDHGLILDSLSRLQTSPSPSLARMFSLRPVKCARAHTHTYSAI